MENLFAFESSITVWLQSTLPFLKPIMQFLSLLGDEFFYMAILPLFVWCINYAMGLRLGIMLMLTSITNMIAKIGFRTPRPYWMDTRVLAMRAETSFGMPSGHAQNAAAMWGIFAARTRNKWVSKICYFIIFLIGFSRIYLGVHYLHDILLGWLFGFLLIFLFWLFEKKVVAQYIKLKQTEKISLAIILSIGTIFLTMVVLMLIGNWAIPVEWVNNAAAASPGNIIRPLSSEGAYTLAGTFGGLLIGLALFINTHEGTPNLEGTIIQKILRYLVGMLGTMIIYFGLKFILPDGETFIALVARFLRYSLLGYWIAGGAPEIFVRIKLISIKKFDISK